MNRDDYRAAFDGIQFRQDFQRDTVNRLLREAGGQHEKECSSMKTSFKTTLLVAVLALTLVVSAAAAVMFLHPSQVAEKLGDARLAAAFEQEDAIVLNQSATSGDYTFNLMGIVSGAGLSDLYSEADAARSYIVASVTRADGQPLDPEKQCDLSFTPLVAGYLPWEINAWTLDGGFSSFITDDMHTGYYIFECDSLEMFADHTVYLAAYEGFAPSSDMFQLGQDGSIAFQDSFTAPHALFTLPLDAAKADPAAVAAFLDKLHQPSPEVPEDPTVDENDPNAKSFDITQDMVEQYQKTGAPIELN